MKTTEFLELLKANRESSLLFEYQQNTFVKPGYHITEVKHMYIESVDCGGKTDVWNETIIQLLEDEKAIPEPMFISKALAIFERVNGLKPFDLEAEVKIEFGNEKFHISQLFINDFETLDEKLILKLAPNKTACKANEACGIVISEPLKVQDACCAEGQACC